MREGPKSGLVEPASDPGDGVTHIASRFAADEPAEDELDEFAATFDTVE